MIPKLKLLVCENMKSEVVGCKGIKLLFCLRTTNEFIEWISIRPPTGNVLIFSVTGSFFSSMFYKRDPLDGRKSHIVNTTLPRLLRTRLFVVNTAMIIMP